MNIKCPQCGNTLNSEIGRYLYNEIGLSNVYIEDIPLYTCVCGVKLPSIYRVGELNDLVAKEVLKKPALLEGCEIKFLRKNLRMPAKSFAEKIGVAITTFSKWENDKQNHNEQNDRLIRASYMLLKNMKQDESREILERLSKIKLIKHYVDDIIVAKRIGDSYIILREQLSSEAASMVQRPVMTHRLDTYASKLLKFSKYSIAKTYESGAVIRLLNVVKAEPKSSPYYVTAS